MSDLISRSAVINLLCNLHIDNIAVNDKKVTEYIRELPTAYDVDAVVEQLEERRKGYERSLQNTMGSVSTYRKGVMRGYEYSRDLVKGGGKV